MNNHVGAGFKKEGIGRIGNVEEDEW